MVCIHTYIYRHTHNFISDLNISLIDGHYLSQWGFPGGAVIGNLPASVEDTEDSCSIPGSGRFPGVGNGNPSQYSCPENPMDRGDRRALVRGVAMSHPRLSG